MLQHIVARLPTEGGKGFKLMLEGREEDHEPTLGTEYKLYNKPN